MNVSDIAKQVHTRKLCTTMRKYVPHENVLACVLYIKKSGRNLGQDLNQCLVSSVAVDRVAFLVKTVTDACLGLQVVAGLNPLRDMFHVSKQKHL